MSLAKRLSWVQPNPSNTGCHTCQWLDSLPPADRKAFNQWLTEGHSKAQLWEICCADDDNPLMVSYTGFRHHLRHHRYEP